MMASRRSIVVVLGIVAFASVCARGEKEKPGEYSFAREANQSVRWSSISHYDYIIVGGGTAGCPLAATLSQKASVLLLERGGSPYGNVNISSIENFHPNLMDVESPRSPTQEFISEDGVINRRARVLAGGTSLNAGFYTRASSRDVKGLGLEPRLVNESYRWIEDIIVHRPLPNEWQSAVAQGLVEAGVSPYNGFTYDHLPGTKVGGTIFDVTGNRHTVADVLQYANPRNLTLLLYATVQRLLFFSSKGKTRPKAYGVVFKDADGVERRAFLKKGKNEIIISAGALGSPQLLMLSGIGPAEELKSLGIRVLIEQPAVGKNMSDNPMNAIWVPSLASIQHSLIQVVGITTFGTYIEASSGFGFSKKDSESGGIILEKVTGPYSKGYLRLNNTNAGDNPVVRFNYFQHPLDLKRCVQGIRSILKVIESQPMKKFTYPNITAAQVLNTTCGIPVNLIPENPEDRVSLDQFCKDKVTTIWHYHGGCQVDSVVDREYRVIGVDGVRVIDGSTFLFSPGTNPQATVMMLGRYMGVRILRERLGRSIVKER